MTKGLIIGKFYPPHKGHKYLIETALTQVDELTVIVCGKKDQTIPPKLRGEWLKKLHPKANVLVIEDITTELIENDPKSWAEATTRWIGHSLDFIFSSEDYGELYAELLGCKHVLVDKTRVKFPISASMIRSNPQEYLRYLDPVVQQYFKN